MKSTKSLTIGRNVLGRCQATLQQSVLAIVIVIYDFFYVSQNIALRLHLNILLVQSWSAHTICPSFIIYLCLIVSGRIYRETLSVVV